MRFEVILPSLGEEDDAVRGGKISMWLCHTGDHLDQDDDFLEITTDKAAFIVPCPVAGTLVEQCVHEGDSVTVGDVLGVLDV